MVAALNVNGSADSRGGYSETQSSGYDDTEGYGPGSYSGDDDRYSDGYTEDGYASTEDQCHVAAAKDTEHQNTAKETFARADNCRPRLVTANVHMTETTYGPCAACGGLTHSAYYCFKRCKMCKQFHDAGKCEAFQELVNLLRAKVDKKDLSPELQELIYGDRLN